MNRPGTTREALIAEAIGDLGQLLDRIETTQILIDGANRHFIQSTTKLIQQSVAFDQRMQALQRSTEQVTQAQIDKASNLRTLELMAMQTEAMTQVAQKLFADTLTPSMQRLVGPLDRLFERLRRPWDTWITHAATAMFSATMTFILTLYLARP